MNLQTGKLVGIGGILPGRSQPGESSLRKSLNWPYLMFSLILLVLGVAGLVRQMGVARLPADFPWAEVQWPTEVRGVELADAESLRYLVEGIAVGEIVTVPFPEGPRSIVTEPTHSGSYLIITASSGLIFWLVACFVFVPRLSLVSVVHFYWLTMLYGLGIFLDGVYFQFGLNPLGMVLNLAQFSSLAFLPAIFLHMTLIFPKRLLGRGGVRHFPVLLYAVAAALVIWQGQAFSHYFNDPNPANALAMRLPQNVADLVMVVEALMAFVIMIGQASKLAPGRERQQARWLVTGFVIGASPYLFLRTLVQLLDLVPIFPPHIDRLFEPAIPLAFVFAVVRYRFLDIDLILRRGILYGFLAAGMAGLILVPVGLMQPDRIQAWPRAWQALPVLCGVLAGVLFLPLRHHLGRWIDRLFFRIEHRVDQILVRVRQELKTVSSQDDLAQFIHGQISEALSPDRCLVLLENVGGETRVGGEPTSATATPDICAPLNRPLWAVPGSTTCPGQEYSAFPVDLADEGFVLSLNLEADGRTVGAVLLGPKSIGHRFVRTDLHLLSELVQAASTRLQEIRLVQKMSEEKMKWAQLDELTRFKDEFLSQVAHDLRTPVTAVGWSLTNMLDGLAGELLPRQKQYLNSMSSSMAHLNHLVSDLLEISRLKKAKLEILTEPCDLAPVLARALGTIGPLAEAATVTLQCTQTPDDLRLLTNGDKLAEVLVNILENGVRYSPPNGVLEVHGMVETDRAVVKVRDHGPGFQGITDPFARFVQGQPSPHDEGGGYGLGLTIAREYTRLMGGEISACNHPGGGAEFTLKLPLPSAGQQGD